jgi:hypothetical protein
MSKFKGIWSKSNPKSLILIYYNGEIEGEQISGLQSRVKRHKIKEKGK